MFVLPILGCTNMKIPFTTRDVSLALNVSPRRVMQLEQAGVLTAIRTPGGQRIFDPDQVEQVRHQRAQAKLARRHR
jgi:DNA-binding transcriptional MerR regulator